MTEVECVHLESLPLEVQQYLREKHRCAQMAEQLKSQRALTQKLEEYVQRYLESKPHSRTLIETLVNDDAKREFGDQVAGIKISPSVRRDPLTQELLPRLLFAFLKTKFPANTDLSNQTFANELSACAWNGRKTTIYKQVQVIAPRKKRVIKKGSSEILTHEKADEDDEEEDEDELKTRYKRIRNT